MKLHNEAVSNLSIKHMQKPTDDEIAEEILVLSERARAAKKILKRKREAKEEEENVSARMDRLESVQEQMSQTLSRLEAMVCDLHVGKFGQQQGKPPRVETEGLVVAEDTHVDISSPSMLSLEKVDTQPLVGVPNIAVSEEAPGDDPYDIRGGSIVKGKVSIDTPNLPTNDASNNGLELETMDPKPGKDVVTDSPKNDQEILKDIATEATSAAIPTRKEEVDVVEKESHEAKPEQLQQGVKVKLLRFDVGEEDFVVGARVVYGIPQEFCHGKQMLEDEISVRVTASYNDGYLIYYPVYADDPPVTTLGSAIDMFIMWPMANVQAITPSKSQQMKADGSINNAEGNEALDTLVAAEEKEKGTVNSQITKVKPSVNRKVSKNEEMAVKKRLEISERSTRAARKKRAD